MLVIATGSTGHLKRGCGKKNRRSVDRLPSESIEHICSTGVFRPMHRIDQFARPQHDMPDNPHHPKNRQIPSGLSTLPSSFADRLKDPVCGGFGHALEFARYRGSSRPRRGGL